MESIPWVRCASGNVFWTGTHTVRKIFFCWLLVNLENGIVVHVIQMSVNQFLLIASTHFTEHCPFQTDSGAAFTFSGPQESLWVNIQYNTNQTESRWHNSHSPQTDWCTNYHMTKDTHYPLPTGRPCYNPFMEVVHSGTSFGNRSFQKPDNKRYKNYHILE